MHKKIFFLVFILAAYLLYTKFVFNPQSLSNFSLIDDGQLIKYGQYLRYCLVDHNCIGFKTQIIDALPDVGLSRLGSWLISGLLYQGPLINAEFQHVLRAYGFGSIMVLLLVLAGLSAGVDSIAIFLGVALFVTNYSFSENIIRLGPIEPYMVIFLGIFSLLFLNLNRFSKKWKPIAVIVSFLVLTCLLLIKEASIAILPAIMITGLLFPKTLKKKSLIIMTISSGAIYFLIKHLLRGPALSSDYAENYKLNFLFIIQNSWNYINLLINSLNPFFSLIIIAPFLLIFRKFREKIVDFHLVYWFLVFICFVSILFPWKFVLDRYLLPAIFAFSIFAMILIGRVIGEIKKEIKTAKIVKVSYVVLMILFLSNLFFIGLPNNIVRSINYKNWFLVFTQFEADQVRAISKINKTVYINAKDNLDNWEVPYEIPMHLAYFYDGKPKIEILGDNIPGSGYIFTRSSLDPVMSPDILFKYPIVESAQYHISQIDSVAFNGLFNLRPVQVFQNPPLDKNEINYFWEIRKIK